MLEDDVLAELDELPHATSDQLAVVLQPADLLLLGVSRLEIAPGKNLEECLTIELAVLESIERQILGVFVSESFDSNDPTDLVTVLFALETLVAVDADDLSKSEVLSAC